MKQVLVVLLALVTACHNSPAEMKSQLDIQGHRGARGLAPENTIPSFLKALEYGVTTLELDLVVSKDSQLVVSHEGWFNHHICLLPDGSPISEDSAQSYKIFQMDYKEVRRFDCGKKGNSRFPDQVNQAAFKPTLRMVREATKEYPVRFNIETKLKEGGDGVFHPAPERFARLLYQELIALNTLEITTVQSFDVRILEVMRKLDADLSIALLVEHEDIASSTLEADLATLSFQPDIFSPNFQYLSKQMVATAHEMGIRVVPWTVNRVEDMRRLVEMGVDGLITDYPNRVPDSF